MQSRLAVRILGAGLELHAHRSCAYAMVRCGGYKSQDPKQKRIRTLQYCGDKYWCVYQNLLPEDKDTTMGRLSTNATTTELPAITTASRTEPYHRHHHHHHHHNRRNSRSRTRIRCCLATPAVMEALRGFVLHVFRYPARFGAFGCRHEASGQQVPTQTASVRVSLAVW